MIAYKNERHTRWEEQSDTPGSRYQTERKFFVIGLPQDRIDQSAECDNRHTGRACESGKKSTSAEGRLRRCHPVTNRHSRARMPPTVVVPSPQR